SFKGTVTPNSIIHIFPLTCSAFYQYRLFWCELLSVGDIGCRDVCLLLNIMELDGTQLVMLKVAQNTFEQQQHQQQCVFPEIMTWLLKIIHRPCCEQFHVGTI
ncbi:hypothetical protein P3378_24580, partial [Vibrio parahaemolyticus]|nr:hypothetical protein [Vibrio parahaemolyticus]